MMANTPATSGDPFVRAELVAALGTASGLQGMAGAPERVLLSSPP